MQPSSDVRRLIEIMAALRDPVAGCPWDIEQTFASIAPFTIEEAYEVADAIERGAIEDLREELGDLLLQVVFHARMAEEAGMFDFGGVVEAITAKLVRRHPHVFGDAKVRSSMAVKALWGRIKAEEKAREIRSAREPWAAREAAAGALDGVPLAMPALTRAMKLQEKAGKVGFDWNDVRAVMAKVSEELAEVEAEIANGFGAIVVRRGRRRPLRGRQPGAAFQSRSRDCVARRQRQVRTTLRPYRESARRARPNPRKRRASMRWSRYGSRQRPGNSGPADAHIAGAAGK